MTPALFTTRVSTRLTQLAALPAALANRPQLELTAHGNELTYTYDGHSEQTGIAALLDEVEHAGVAFRDLQTRQSSLEDIFVGLVHSGDAAPESLAEGTGA